MGSKESQGGRPERRARGRGAAGDRPGWDGRGPPGAAGRPSVPPLGPQREPSAPQLCWLSKSKYFSTLAGGGHTRLSAGRQLPMIGFKSLYKVVFLED